MDTLAIKDAFSRAKIDIQTLKEQMLFLSNEISEIRTILEQIYRQSVQQTNQHTDDFKGNYQSNQDSEDIISYPNIYSSVPTHESSESNNLTEHSNTPTNDWAYKPLKPHIYHISTGNGGVPTDSQTNQQTNQHPNTSYGNTENSNLSNLLNSLDTVKTELRNKFKRLTKQEMLIFSTIFQLEEEHLDVDYPLIAKRLSLSESSIRDYVQKIVKKGIPVDKIRENNKKIYLKISPDLKKIATLPTLIQLREI